MARRNNLHKQAGYIDADFLHPLTFPLQSDGGPYIPVKWPNGSQRFLPVEPVRLYGSDSATRLPQLPRGLTLLIRGIAIPKGGPPGHLCSFSSLPSSAWVCGSGYRLEADSTKGEAGSPRIAAVVELRYGEEHKSRLRDRVRFVGYATAQRNGAVGKGHGGIQQATCGVPGSLSERRYPSQQR
jgi:hypothetical protein